MWRFHSRRSRPRARACSQRRVVSALLWRAPAASLALMIRPTIDDIHVARERIAGAVLRTPLVRLEHGLDAPEIWLKLENLQPINAFKLRGAANAVFALPAAERERGVWTISAGNAGQGVAWAARAAGIPCTVVVIETAAQTKIDRMEKLGATLVRAPFDVCWKAMQDRSFPGIDAAFVHPFDDDDFIAGNASIALEILEDLPTVRAVVASIGGGGLIAGIGIAMHALAPHVEVWGAEPATAAPAHASFAAGEPREFSDWSASFIDGAGGRSMFPSMWDRIRTTVKGSIVMELDPVRNAMRLVAEKNRVIAEGAGALAVAAALSGELREGPIVAVVSGGNIDLARWAELIL